MSSNDSQDSSINGSENKVKRDGFLY
jgi:hypothetical protein